MNMLENLIEKERTTRAEQSAKAAADLAAIQEVVAQVHCAYRELESTVTHLRMGDRWTGGIYRLQGDLQEESDIVPFQPYGLKLVVADMGEEYEEIQLKVREPGVWQLALVVAGRRCVEMTNAAYTFYPEPDGVQRAMKSLMSILVTWMADDEVAA